MLALYASSFSRAPQTGSYKDYYLSSRQQETLSVNNGHMGFRVNLEQPSDVLGGGSRVQDFVQV